MKPTAWLLNIGRGPVIDEGALLRALADKRIAGAMLTTTCGATSQAENSATS